MTTLSNAPPLPASLRGLAIVGAAWNAFGVVQFALQSGATRASLMAGGMNAADADLYAGLPAWMTASFGAAVIAGLLASAAVLLRRSIAVPALALSLGAYILLAAGDVYFGVFAAFGAPTIAILTFSIGLAASLLASARRAAAQGRLV